MKKGKITDMYIANNPSDKKYLAPQNRAIIYKIKCNKQQQEQITYIESGLIKTKYPHILINFYQEKLSIINTQEEVIKNGNQFVRQSNKTQKEKISIPEKVYDYDAVIGQLNHQIQKVPKFANFILEMPQLEQKPKQLIKNSNILNSSMLLRKRSQRKLPKKYRNQ